MQAPPPEKKRKETLLSAELGKFLDKRVRVKFQGGREGENMQLASFRRRRESIFWPENQGKRGG